MNKKNILIVEDQSIIAIDEWQIVHDLGYEVAGIFGSGEEALESIKLHKPDLVLMDIFLEGNMDGRETALKIMDLYQIPVIFITAYGDKKEAQSIKDSMPLSFGYIIKPFTKEELEYEINELIN